MLEMASEDIFAEAPDVVSGQRDLGESGAEDSDESGPGEGNGWESEASPGLGGWGVGSHRVEREASLLPVAKLGDYDAATLFSVFSSKVYLAPNNCIRHRGTPIAFDSAEEMSRFIHTKSPKYGIWNDLAFEHITVLESEPTPTP
jgi:hypothetical protein